MTKRRSSAEETRVFISKDSSGNFIHSTMTIPPSTKGVPTSGKSVIVMSSKVSKRNLKNVFTDVRKIPGLMEKNIPKTKLIARDDSHDRRSPSPRLKNFPAEKIKKIDGNVLLQPHNESNIASHPEQDCGHGDALATSQQIQISPRHQSNNVPKSQQNISYFYQIDNSNQSEGVLPLQRETSSVVQPHRPFVPNSPAGMIQKQTPKKQVTPRPIASHMPSIYPADLSRHSDQDYNKLKKRNQEPAKREENQHQESLQVNSEILESDYGKQPIGGRVAALHRQAVLEKKQISPEEMEHHKNLQEQQHKIQQQNQPQRSQLQQNQLQRSQLQQNQFQHNQLQQSQLLQYLIPQQPNSQQVHQPLQNNAAHQQHMHQRAMLHQQNLMNQMQQKAYYEHFNQKKQQPSSGMTSPQDLSINKQKYHQTGDDQMQKPANKQVFFQNPVPNNKGNPNVRAQLNPFTINLIHPNPSQYQSHLQTDWQKTAPPDNIHSTNQHSSPTDRENQQSGQNNHQMKSSTQEEINTQSIQQQKQTTCKKVYIFTPQMLKDQEQLVTAMQQQQVPEDVMQRQFQLLLNEQKKQLAYLEAMTGSDEKVDEKSASSVSKKITRFEVDEKPDWMSRITPPRIPYCEIEKAKIHSSGQKLMNVPHHQQVQDQQNVIQHQQQVPHQQQVQHQQNFIPHQQQPQQQSRLENQVQHQRTNLQNQVPSQYQVQQQAQLQNQVLHQHQIQQLSHLQNPVQHQHHVQQQQAQLRNQIPHQHQAQQQAQLQNQVLLQRQVQQQQAHLQNQVPHQLQVQQQQAQLQNQVLQQQSYLQNHDQRQQQNQHQHQEQIQHQQHMQKHQHPQHMVDSRRLDKISPNFYHPYYHPYYYQHHPEFNQHIWQNWQQSPVPPSYVQQHTLETNSHQSKENLKTVEPSSLLKLRLYKEVIQPQKRNNGLQDPDTVKEAYEALKNAETKKGLEYVANLNKKEQVVRLNGIQEPGEIPGNLMQGPPPESLQPLPKKVSANGLENQRNPDNPPPPPTIKMRHLDDQVNEYPRIKRTHQPRNYTHVAERENGSVDPNSHHQCYHQNHQFENAHNQEPMRRSYPEVIQQQQFYDHQYLIGINGQGEGVLGEEYVKQPGGCLPSIGAPCIQYGDVIMRIQEPRIIGGVMYLARKPDSIPNSFIPAESFNGNKYIPQNVVS